MYDELEDSRAITSFRRVCIMVDCLSLTQCITVEDVVLTLENVLSDGTEVRLVNGEDKSSDRITTVLRLRGIPIDARLRAIDSAELIRRSFTDGSADGIEDRFVHDEVDAPERTLAVDVGRIVMIDTRCME